MAASMDYGRRGYRLSWVHLVVTVIALVFGIIAIEPARDWASWRLFDWGFIAKTVLVPATASAGVETGIYLRAGDAIEITATGRASYGYENTGPCTGMVYTDPDGRRSSYPNDILNQGDRTRATRCPPKERADNMPLPEAPVGSLLGWIGEDDPLLQYFGSSSKIVSDKSGFLYLQFNDGTPTDNLGQFKVSVRRR